MLYNTRSDQLTNEKCFFWDFFRVWFDLIGQQTRHSHSAGVRTQDVTRLCYTLDFRNIRSPSSCLIDVNSCQAYQTRHRTSYSLHGEISPHAAASLFLRRNVWYFYHSLLVPPGNLSTTTTVACQHTGKVHHVVFRRRIRFTVWIARKLLLCEQIKMWIKQCPVFLIINMLEAPLNTFIKHLQVLLK